MKVKTRITNSEMELTEDFVKGCGGNKLIAKILYNRGYQTLEDVKEFLDMESYKPTHYSEFPNMEKALDIIIEAVKKNCKICVYGDYDVDGVTSTVVLMDTLRRHTDNILYHVPDRFKEGYGMNKNVVKALAEQGVNLIITCDCGISNIEEIALAKELGMNVVLTDHHKIGDALPVADAILNPKLLPEGHRARNISGCTMAYFVCVGLNSHFHNEMFNDDLLDMVGLSTVADVVSLTGENRHLLKKSMDIIFGTSRMGLRALINISSQSGEMNTEEDIAFSLAPRINAAGRMASARLPVDLFLTQDENVAIERAQHIDILNKERKEVQKGIIDEGLELAENNKKNQNILVLYGKEWHHGIIGIAAGKICETYQKPTILLSLKEDGETVVGSARSIEGVNVYSLLKESSEYLLKFGGHTLAAGLSIQKDMVVNFMEKIQSIANKTYSNTDEVVIKADAEVDFSQLDEELYDELRELAPFGEGFAQPVFVSREVTVVSDRKTAKNHHIMVLQSKGGVRINGVKWFGEDYTLEGKKYDVVFKLGRQNYKGNTDLQLTIDHFIEIGMAKQALFEGTIIDERCQDLQNILSTNDTYEYFYEGLQKNSPFENTSDRKQIKSCSNLVLLSIPTNINILRAVVAKASPQKIILNLGYNVTYSFKEFIGGFMGIVKYVCKNTGGKIDIEDLCIKLSVEEVVIITALEYLGGLGKIEYFIDDEYHQLNVRLVEKTAINVFLKEKHLKEAMLEKNAYQKYFLEASIQEISKNLK